MRSDRPSRPRKRLAAWIPRRSSFCRIAPNSDAAMGTLERHSSKLNLPKHSIPSFLNLSCLVWCPLVDGCAPTVFLHAPEYASVAPSGLKLPARL